MFIILYAFAVLVIFLTVIYAFLAFIYSLFSSYVFNFTMFTLLLVTQYLAPMQLNQAIRPLYVLSLLAMFVGLGAFEVWWEYRTFTRQQKMFQDFERVRQEQKRNQRKEDAKPKGSSKGSLAWCYEVLGVPETATPQEVKAAYRRMALRYHPDVNKSRDAEARMKEINEAYERLNEELARGRARNT